MPPRTDINENEIIELYNKFISIEEIARRLNCSATLVKKRLLKNGVILRSRNEIAELRKQKIEVEEVYELYSQGYSLDKLALMFDTTAEIISARFRDNNLTMRTRLESQETRSDVRLKNKHWLYEQYIVLDKSTLDIADELDTTVSTVSRWLDKHDISKEKHPLVVEEVVKLYESGLSAEKVAEIVGYSSTTICRVLKDNNIDIRYKMTKKEDLPSQIFDKDYLEYQYLTLKKPIALIAKELNVSDNVIRKRIKQFNIPIRENVIKDAYELGYLKPKYGAENGHYGKDAAHGKGTWVNLNGKWHYMRSTWEVIVAKYLFMNGYNFKYEEVRFNLGDTTYKPDFFIYNEKGELDYIIEVKGWFKPEFIRKMMLFQTLYPDIDYVIWDKEIVYQIMQEVA